jgi:hypothetical protein
MNKLRFLLGILIAVFFCETLVRLASPVIGPSQNVWQIQQQAKVIKLQERPKDLGLIDLVIMGDSTAKEGIDPEVLDTVVGDGFHTFNAALNSSTSYTILKQADLVLRYAKPRFLLVLIGPGTWRESDIDEVAQTYDLTSNVDESNTLKKFFERYLYLYKYRNSLRDPFILNTFIRSIRYQSLREGVVYRNVDTIKFNGDSIFPRGNFSFAEGKWQLPLNEPGGLVLDLPTATMVHLQNLLETCERTKTTLILGTVPTSQLNQDYRSLVASMAFNLGVEFIQGNDATTNSMDFSDGVHLNSNGAMILSSYVGEWFQTIEKVRK